MRTNTEDIIMTGDTHEQSGTDLPLDLGDRSPSDSGLVTYAPDGDDDLLGDFDADDPGSAEECVFLGFLGLEDDSELPPGMVHALDNAAQHHVSNAEARKTGVAKRHSITEEDFEEGAPRNAFIIIRSQATNLFSKDPRIQKRRPEAIDFFFTRIDNGEDATFDLCCDVLDTRADVFRMRIVYELWLRAVQFTNPMPFETVPLPEIVQNEAYLLCGPVGLAVGNAIWNWPGVDEETIYARCEHLGHSRKDSELALQRMYDELILSELMGGWYLTGRNPVRQSMRDQTRFGGKSVQMITQTVHWSRLF